MSSPEIKPLWLVRQRLDAGHYRKQFLGGVVEYPDLPTERYISPPSSLSSSRKLCPLGDILPSLNPEPLNVRNISFLTRRIGDPGLRSSVDEILKEVAWHNPGRSFHYQKNVTMARVWHMERPGETFEELLQDEGYFWELLGMLRGSAHKQAYFVTDIVSLVNTRMSGPSDKGASSSLDPSVEAMSSGITEARTIRAQSTRNFEACYEEETIVFMGYRLIKLEKMPGVKAKLKRMFNLPRGGAEGFMVHDGSDYWPEVRRSVVGGKAEALVTPDQTPRSQYLRLETNKEYEDIVEEIGFDVEIVG